ncbi:histone acetylation protein 2 [Xylariomycetidae sp. FL2044]|nr:histone acetylation protein 2 [Xylariomycetidae sp. FL2044]
MPSSAPSHARSHALLLFQKLLNLRDSASPLTLVLDTLEQSAKPVLQEFLSRAKVAKSKIIFISFGTLKKPAAADIFIRARGKTPEALRLEITSHYPSGTTGHQHKVLLLIDTLNPLCASAPTTLPLFLSSLITPLTSLVAIYHTDIPVLAPSAVNEYEPHPLTILSHLATAILRVSSLWQAVERQAARNRSLPEPEWGLGEGREGVLIGLRGQTRGGGTGRRGEGEEQREGLVVEMEIRRRSGRAVSEKFVLVPGGPSRIAAAAGSVIRNNGSGKSPLPSSSSSPSSKVYLLSDHAAFRDPAEEDNDAGDRGLTEDGEGAQTTFNLGLTEKQRRDREGIVLPYFDAQRDIGAGEGGRILYEMGREDDFDDEEDEI